MTGNGVLINIRRFWRARRGSVVVEFALVAPMLFAVIFSTIEAGWLMTQSIMLDHALDRSVRSLRIGTLPDATQEILKQDVCEKALILQNCDTMLTIELIPIPIPIGSPSDFPTDGARCINRSTNIAPVLRYNAGARSETVFVRACFVVDPITPLMGLALRLPRDGTGALNIVSSSAFANEPGG